MARLWGILGVCGLVACAGDPGRLTNARAALPQLAPETASLLVESAGGLVRFDLGARRGEELAPSRYHLLTRSPDASVLVLGDDDTNLYVRRSDESRIRRIVQLDGRTGAVALRPDGTVIAVARHADFSLPQSEWAKTEDNGLFFIDTRTLEVRTLGKTQDVHLTGLAWTLDGSQLVTSSFTNTTERVDVASLKREPLAAYPREGLAGSRGNAPSACQRTGQQLSLRGWGGDDGIDLKDADGKTRRLVLVEGRKRGFHDHLPTISSFFFTGESCRHAVFIFQQQVWLVDVQTGVVENLLSGYSATLLTGKH